MKLWILRPRNITNPPWNYGHGMLYGAVVREETEEKARALLAKHSEFEGDEAWLDASLSSCEELTNTGKPSIILDDLRE